MRRPEPGIDHPELDLAGLRAAFEPRSIAVIGASNDPARIGGRPLLGARQWDYAGQLYAVNPNSAEVQGLRSYGSVRDIGAPIDLAIIAVSAPHVARAIQDCAASGVKAAILFSSGFAEIGADGQVAQDGLVAAARVGGMRLIGPNCMGILNPFRGVVGSFTSVIEDRRPDSSGISLASQSGAFGVHCIALMRQRGLGLGLWGTSGNQADIDVADILGYMAQAPESRVILGCLEAVKDARRFRAALALARRNRIPVVIMKIGRSDVGAQAAATHTASLAGSDEVFGAVLRQYGVHRAGSVDELFDIGYACAAGRFPRRSTVGLISISGGFGIIMADAARDAGLDVPPLPAATQDRLHALVPFAGTRNPLDVTAQFVNDFSIVRPMFDALLGDGGHESLVCYVGATGIVPQLMDRLKPVFADITRRYPDRLLFLSMICGPDVRREYEALGYLVFEEPSRAIAALAVLRGFTASFQRGDDDVAPEPIAAVQVGTIADEVGAKLLLQRYGVPTVPERVAAGREAAVRAAIELGFPVVLKLLARDVIHKSELGGVVLNIADAAAVALAFDTIVQRASRVIPADAIDGVVVAPMVADGVEMILGAKRDPVFGQMLMLGMGGIFVDLLGPTVLRTAPVTKQQARDMIGALRGLAILHGARGRSPADVESLADCLVAVGAFCAANDEWLAELDINPLLVRPDGKGVVAVDAVITARQELG